MIDFHSHFLPGIDDGSSTVEESVLMLRRSYEQGVREIVATPHYYAYKYSPETFLRRREMAWRRLRPAYDARMPRVHLGAEVYYFEGMGESEKTRSLCINGTNVLLLEMPFKKWTRRQIDEVIDLARYSDMKILLAHIDRYLEHESRKVWEELAGNGVLFQVNGSFFLEGYWDRRKALKLLEEGRIAVLGSDCHNMSTRLPNLGEACTLIHSKYGQEAISTLNHQAKELLYGEYRIK